MQVLLMYAVLGSVMNRIRGGLLDTPLLDFNRYPRIRTISKISNDVVFGLSCYLVSGSVLIGIVGAMTMMLGRSWGWGSYVGAIDTGVNSGGEEVKWIDAITMKGSNHMRLRGVAALSLRGAMWTSLIASGLSVVTLNLGMMWIAPIGLLMGVCYYIGSRIYKGYIFECGEALFGAIMWMLIFYILGCYGR